MNKIKFTIVLILYININLFSQNEYDRCIFLDTLYHHYKLNDDLKFIDTASYNDFTMVKFSVNKNGELDKINFSKRSIKILNQKIELALKSSIKVWQKTKQSFRFETNTDYLLPVYFEYSRNDKEWMNIEFLNKRFHTTSLQISSVFRFPNEPRNLKPKKVEILDIFQVSHFGSCLVEK